ncbi:MAG: hypothetical protein J1E29_06955 [Duncaniella sp.]|nr:hypothetical protein [Duncaniella sp.]
MNFSADCSLFLKPTLAPVSGRSAEKHTNYSASRTATSPCFSRLIRTGLYIVFLHFGASRHFLRSFPPTEE